MMNELQIFNNPEFGEIRTLTINDEIWFVSKDISERLGYAQTSNMLKRVEDEDKASSILDDTNLRYSIINESGLYSAVIGSKIESAKRFKRWITSEVLPSIRKNGGYIAGQEEMSDQELIAKALVVAQRTIENKNLVIKKLQEDTERMKPKEIFADAIGTSNSVILIGELAKILNQNGIDTGEKRLFKWMREHKYLTSKNLPTQKAADLKIFRICEGTWCDIQGETHITKTTKVTPKGQKYFLNKFLSVEEN